MQEECECGYSRATEGTYEDGNVLGIDSTSVNILLVLWFCKTLPMGETGKRVHRITLYCFSPLLSGWGESRFMFVHMENNSITNK